MSLDKAAKHLAAHGRGPDTELVHMTKDEVKGLQQMAMAAGGSLTINPHTGLAEAGFLSKMLPTVAGIAAGALTANPMIGAAVAGGLTAATTGSLQQGIIAGGMAYAGGELLGPATPGTPAPVTDYSTAFTAPLEGAAPIAPVASPPPAGASYTPTELNNIARGQGVFPEGSSALPGSEITGNASLPPSAQAPAEKSFFGNLTTPQKVALGGTGLLAATSLMNQAGRGGPGAIPVANTMRLSPDFQGYTPRQPKPYYQADYTRYAAGGGLMDAGYAPGGPVEQMTMKNQNQFYPQGQQEHTNFATPTQMPTSAEVVNAGYEPTAEPYTDTPVPRFASGGDPKKKKKASLTTAAKLAAMDPHEAAVAGLGNAMYHSQMPAETAKGLQPTMNLGDLNLADGGHLGSYSDGGRLLKGPGDGVSDSIPARIGKHQPARLADGEFVIPARIVSELGNGSTDAGARKLYEMMDKVQASRKKSMGKGKFAVNSRAAKYLPKK